MASSDFAKDRAVKKICVGETTDSINNVQCKNETTCMLVFGI